jgi:hypothetical protein
VWRKGCELRLSSAERSDEREMGGREREREKGREERKAVIEERGKTTSSLTVSFELKNRFSRERSRMMSAFVRKRVC